MGKNNFVLLETKPIDNMNNQEVYEEWKSLNELEKKVKSRKKYLRNEMVLNNYAYVPISGESMSDRNEEMENLYRQGKKLQEIGDHFNITRERVRQVLTARGVTRAVLGEERDKIIYRSIERGEEVEGIADKAKLSEAYTKRIGLKRGLIIETNAQKVTRKRDEKVISLYEEGLSQTEIAKKTDTVQTNISRILKKYDKNPAQVPVHEVIRLRKEGCTCKEIGNRLNTSGANVYRILRKNRGVDNK